MAKNRNFFDVARWENILHSFPFIIKLFIISTDQHQGLLFPPPKKKNGSKSSNFLNIFFVFKVYKDFFICYYFVISTGSIVNGNKIFKK